MKGYVMYLVLALTMGFAGLHWMDTGEPPQRASHLMQDRLDRIDEIAMGVRAK